MSGLSITRRVGESFVIGDDIRVTITQISMTQVRVLIDAPRDIRVDRSEVRERINAERSS